MEKLRAINAAIAFLFFSVVCLPSIASDLHAKIDTSIISLASSDSTQRKQAAAFLLSAPQVFRDNMNAKFQEEVQSLSESLPQQIDGYTAINSVLLTEKVIYMNYMVYLKDEGSNVKIDQDIKETIRNQSLMQVCRTPGSVLLALLFGRDVVRDYMHEDGSPFFSVRISWDDCDKLL